jgi:hypothetical protein
MESIGSDGQNFDYFLSFIFICLIRLICLKFNYINILSPVGCPTDWTDLPQSQSATCRLN